MIDVLAKMLEQEKTFEYCIETPLNKLETSRWVVKVITDHTTHRFVAGNEIGSMESAFEFQWDICGTNMDDTIKMCGLTIPWRYVRAVVVAYE